MNTRTPVLRRLRLPALLVGALVFVASCAEDAPLDTLDPAGESAQSIDNLSMILFIICGVVLALVVAASIYIFAKFRVKEYDEDNWPEQTHGNTALEIGWTIAPAALLAVVAVLTVAVLWELFTTDNEAIAVEVEGEVIDWEPTIVVVGQQWWWEYRYYFDEVDLEDFDAEGEEGEADYNIARNLPPADIVTSTQMVIPADQEVELLIMSRDVIHSHWIPRLNGKRDALPGSVNDWKIQADEAGVYFGQCTEYCGLSHSRMRMQTIALDEVDFQAWIDQQMQDAAPPSAESEAWLASVAAASAQTESGAEQAEVDAEAEAEAEVVAPEATAAERGLVAFTQLCTSCHLIEGVNDATYNGADQVSGAAPNLTHFASRTTFAGGLLETYEEDESGNIVFNRNDMAQWLRNPESVKAMDPENRRGMPNLGLDQGTIQDLISYLETLGQVPGPNGGQDVIEASLVD